MKLSAAVLVLLALGALGEVVVDFESCKDFFFKQSPPVFTIKNAPSDQYKKICQRYSNQYRYATLYDTVRRIPVYSAYQYKDSSDCDVSRPERTWMIEPQLETGGKEPNMNLQRTLKVQNQAKNLDYENSRYDKGHLFPFCHTQSQETAESTFTLTNAAPQRCDFNKIWYSEVERKVKESLNNCVKKNWKAHVVVGVVPSNPAVTLKNNPQVNVPSHFWMAYTCCDNNYICEPGFYILGKEDDEATTYKQADQFNNQLKDLYKADSFSVFTENTDQGSPPAKKPRKS